MTSNKVWCTCIHNVHILIHYFVVQDDAECPSIGELIDLLEAAQIVQRTGGKDKTVAEILTESFTLKYPHIQINRPSRFLDTVNRLAAPTKPSSIGDAKLSGTPLAHYRRRQWSPRNRCKKGILIGLCVLSVHMFCFWLP